MEAGSSLIARFQAAQAAVDSAVQDRNRVEARESTFKDELVAFRDRLKQEGIDPANIDQLISEKEAEIEAHLSELEGNLSGEGQPAQETRPPQPA